MIHGWYISCKIAPWRLSLDLTDDKSTLIRVMAWCRQAPSHYLNQCWLKSISPHGVTRPQWVKGVIFKLIIQTNSLDTEICSRVNATKPHQWEVTIASGNGLVLSGNTHLCESLLILIPELKILWIFAKSTKTNYWDVHFYFFRKIWLQMRKEYSIR